MTDRPATAIVGIPPQPAARLEPNAIGVAQDTVIGMASSAPAATVGLSLAALAAATAYGSGPILILTAIPMLIIANAYRRLNMWNANCGASFEWVGRAINPYLGFLTGWLMIAAYIIGTVAEVLAARPVGPGRVRVQFHQHLAVHRHRRRGRHHHADHRRRGHQDHRAGPGRHGGGRVPHPDRARRGRPRVRAQPPPGHRPRSPRAGSACPGSTARAARWPDSSSRCSSTAAGTAPCT